MHQCSLATAERSQLHARTPTSKHTPTHIHAATVSVEVSSTLRVRDIAAASLLLSGTPFKHFAFFRSAAAPSIPPCGGWTQMCQLPHTGGSHLADGELCVVQVQRRLHHRRLQVAAPAPRRLVGVVDGSGGGGRLAGHFARCASCRERRAGAVWPWAGRGSRLMKCSLSHARLWAECVARDSSAAALGVA